MGSVLALLVIVLVSLLVVRLGTNALVLTGMSLEAAKFQAASAFFGVGFTTSEAELVVEHPVRRRIILHLIIAGNIGLTSAGATLIVTFVNSPQTGGLGHAFLWIGLLLLAAFMAALVYQMPVISKPLDHMMRWSLQRAGLTRAQDFELLLNLRDGFCVSDFEIEKGHPWAGRKLMESRPADHGIVILGIQTVAGGYTGAPNKDQILQVGDVVMVYGREVAVAEAVDGRLMGEES